ncbi:SPP1 gp7 family phage head morphogenesis protein [Hungatella hathewayi 12489931]|uniref:minor capsid protein n=1 Tax=Hungatella hathewayi TaxID=154046 RepID=UPI0002D1CE40|nr:minor capsid protein [Hungatella hathewayi]ENY93819.1 SPP1 gp7 family phage head morphogenesis protein [Hungatella hathewayi 12489931]
MARQNSAYWQKRMEALEDKQYQNGAEYYKDVQKQFREASNNVQVDIERWYQRLADNNNLSYAGAKKLLKKDELDEFHWSVEQYIKAGEENAVDQRWLKELENASARHHISYLEAMKLQTQQHAELLSTEFEGGMTEFLHKSYGDQYYHTAFEIAKGTGLGSNMAQIDSRTIDTLIKKPWAQDGKNFSDRIWTNKDKLVNNLHTELTQSIIRGADLKQAIDNLAKTMEVSKAQAGRLIMTESAAISAAAQKDCFKDLAVERYEILATLDSHTSDICQEMDGKVFEMKDYEVGTTAPPFHPNCRSTTIPYFDDEFTKDEERAARDEDTGKTHYVPADMKYEEWEKQAVVNSMPQDQEIKITKKMNQNAYSVDRHMVNSKEYHDKYEQLNIGKNTAEQAYVKAKDMLEFADGTQMEYTCVLDARTGNEVFYSKGVNKATANKVAITKEQYDGIISHDGEIILMHNHPSSGRPSGQDIMTVFRVPNAKGSLVAGHDGVVYYISDVNRNVDIDKIYKKHYDKHVREILNIADTAPIPEKIGKDVMNQCKIKATTDLYTENQKKKYFKIRRL